MLCNNADVHRCVYFELGLPVDYHAVIKYSLKYFSNTKFVYRKIEEVLVFAWTHIVKHFVQEFAFSQNLSALITF